MSKKRNKTRKRNNKKGVKRSGKRRASMHKNKSGNKTSRKLKRAKKGPLKGGSSSETSYNVGDHVIMKPIKVTMSGRSEAIIQYKNVRIDKINTDNYEGTIIFPDGNERSNYKFYLHEIESKIE